MTSKFTSFYVSLLLLSATLTGCGVDTLSAAATTAALQAEAAKNAKAQGEDVVKKMQGATQAGLDARANASDLN